MQRYGMFIGSNPELKVIMRVSGPQNADQVPDAIKQLLDQPGTKRVAVIYDRIGTGDHIVVYNKIQD